MTSDFPIERNRRGSSSGPRYRDCLLVLLVLGSGSSTAAAHAFATPYTLPVPFAMYAFGASAALALSFVIAALSMAGSRLVPAAVGVEPPGSPTIAPHNRVPHAVGLALLLLTIATGLVGTRNAWTNWNMTFFWIVFVLGVAYVVALIGDFYALFNPWVAVVDLVGSIGVVGFAGKIADPRRLGSYPALILYMGFIWFELFAHAGPFGLSVALSIYTVCNLSGAWLLGRDAWFEQGEFFAIFMRLLGKMSVRARPWGKPPGSWQPGRMVWRLPFVGLLEGKANGVSLIIFIMFMLSSTAFDGLHETSPWNRLFWAHIYPFIAPLFPTSAARKFIVSVQLLDAWQWLSLVVLPFLYLATYALFIVVMKTMVRSKWSVAELMKRFAFSLIPIAFVYHFTHYYTLLLSQAPQIAKLVSDPFGFGWNLFGTANVAIDPLLVDASAIWHTQVAFIVLGHIAGVYLAHVEAMRLFRTPRSAAISQLPMLVLMMLFTTLGLWILSLPLGTGS